MGKSLTFKSILDEIQKDVNSGYYADIFTQYGRLIRTIFDFDPMETAAFQANGIDWDALSEIVELQKKELLRSLTYTFDHFNRTTLSAMRKMESYILGAADPTFNLPPFKGIDAWKLIWGFIQGGVSVLPDSSLITFCKTNASSIPDTYKGIVNNFNEVGRTTDALKGVQ
jgi:hypothetical protein